MSTPSANNTTLPSVPQRRTSTSSASDSTAVSPVPATANPSTQALRKSSSTTSVSPKKETKYVTLPRPSKAPTPSSSTAADALKPLTKSTAGAAAYGRFVGTTQPAQSTVPKSAKTAPTQKKVNVQRALKVVESTQMTEPSTDAKEPTCERAVAPATTKAPAPLTATAISIPVARQSPSGPLPPHTTTSPRATDRSSGLSGAAAAQPPLQPQPPRSPPRLPRTGLFRSLGDAPAAPPAKAFTAKQRKLAALCAIIEYRPLCGPNAIPAAFCAASPLTRTLTECTPMGLPVGDSAIRLVLQQMPPGSVPPRELQRVVFTERQKVIPTTPFAAVQWWLERSYPKVPVVLNAQQISDTGRLEGPLTAVIHAANFTRSQMTTFEVKEVSPRLAVLGLGFCGNLAVLRGCERLTVLTKIDLSFSRIGTLDALSGCKRLESVSLSSCDQVTDITPIMKLPAMKELFAMGVSVYDVKEMARCKTLTSVVISSPNLTDFTPIGKLPDLQMLSLNNSQVSTLSWVAGLANLKHVEVNNCAQLKDISPLATLPNIEHIDANFSAVENAAGFSKCKTLKHIGLIRSPVNADNIAELETMNIDIDL